MKFTYIYNACILVEHQNIKVLCDPWLQDGIYYGSWYQYPKPNARAQDFFDVDYIYISHIHPDHLDVATLELFPKNIPLVICNYAHKFLKKILDKMGFESIIELFQGQKLELSSDFFIEVIAADFCDPSLCQKYFSCTPGSSNSFQTQQIDSLAVFSSLNHTLVNLNDIPYSLAQKAMEHIIQSYSKIDCALISYSGAGPYPQCFDHLSIQEKQLKARLKQKQFLNQSIAFLKKLKPEFFMPFAGQYLLGGSLSHLNSLRGVPNIEELPELFKVLLKKFAVTSQFLLLNSMEYFDLVTKKSSRPFIAPSPGAREQYQQEISQAPLSYHSLQVDALSLNQLIQSAYNHLISYQKQWNYLPKQDLYIDYGEKMVLCLPKDQSSYFFTQKIKEPYVKITLDRRLFFQILIKKAHWNNAEIGSHLTFERKPDFFDRSFYLTLSYFHV